MSLSRRLVRVLAVGPIGALLAVGLSVIPATTVQAQVVHHTKAAEVSGPLERSEVRQLPFPASHAALYWTGNPNAAVTVAFSSDGVTFGPPTPIEEDEVGMQLDNGQTYGAILPALGASFARVSSDRPLGRLTVLALAEDGTSVEKTPVPGGKPAGATGLALPRSAWGADENLRFRGPTALWPPVFQTVQKLVVHHTAGANGESGDAAKATIRSIYYYHTVTQGWGDIGYNFLIDAAGVVYKGRSTSPTKTDADTTGENGASQGVTAGHAYGYNSGTVGVALLGNFVTTPATPEADVALKNVLIAKASSHGLNTHVQSTYTNPLTGTQASFENVPGHTEVPDNATECPGGVFLDRLRSLRDEVFYGSTTPDTAAPSGPSGLTGVSSKRSVQLKWSASAGDAGSGGGGTSGLAGYDVYRGGVRVGSTTGLTYTDGAPTRGPNVYTVKAYDGAANRSVASNPVTVTG